jgi:hypothetical protein
MPLHFPLFHDASEAPNTLCPSSIAVKAHCAKGGMAAFQTLSEFILLCSEDMGLGELKACMKRLSSASSGIAPKQEQQLHNQVVVTRYYDTDWRTDAMLTTSCPCYTNISPSYANQHAGGIMEARARS